MKTISYSLFALLAGTTIAAAQSLGGAGYINGEVQFEYGWANGGSGDLTRADVTLGFEAGDFSLGRFGAEIGLKGYFSVESSLDTYALFPVVWVEGNYGRVSIGAPRSAMADRVAMPKFGGSYITHIHTESFFNFSEAQTMFYDRNSYGIRYDTMLGGYDIGVSYHRYPDIDAGAVTAAVARDFGAFDFAIGFEADADNIGSNNNIAATLGYDVGQYGARLTMGRTTSGGDGFGYALNAFYRPTDRIKLEATYANYDFAGIGNVYGVNAEYAVLDNAALGIGYMNGDAFSDTVGIYMRWNLNN